MFLPFLNHEKYLHTIIFWILSDLLNSLHHVVFSTSRMPSPTERRFCRPRWKLLSISRSEWVNSGPWQPLKHGRALCWPSSQRANWCWESHTWEKQTETISQIANIHTEAIRMKTFLWTYSLWWKHNLLEVPLIYRGWYSQRGLLNNSRDMNTKWKQSHQKLTLTVCCIWLCLNHNENKTYCITLNLTFPIVLLMWHL